MVGSISEILRGFENEDILSTGPMKYAESTESTGSLIDIRHWCSDSWELSDDFPGKNFLKRYGCNSEGKKRRDLALMGPPCIQRSCLMQMPDIVLKRDGTLALQMNSIFVH